jgi:hypothetical protein
LFEFLLTFGHNNCIVFLLDSIVYWIYENVKAFPIFFVGWGSNPNKENIVGIIDFLKKKREDKDKYIFIKSFFFFHLANKNKIFSHKESVAIKFKGELKLKDFKKDNSKPSKGFYFTEYSSFAAPSEHS